MMNQPGLERSSNPAAPFVPMLYDDAVNEFAAVALVHNFGESDGEIEPGLAIWILEMPTVSDARECYEWMLARPERWPVWAGLAPLVSSGSLALMMADERDMDDHRAAGHGPKPTG